MPFGIDGWKMKILWNENVCVRVVLDPLGFRQKSERLPSSEWNRLVLEVTVSFIYSSSHHYQAEKLQWQITSFLLRAYLTYVLCVALKKRDLFFRAMPRKVYSFFLK